MNELSLINQSNKPFYCSVSNGTMEDKKKLFNALENCDKLLNDCVGEHIKIKDVYIEQFMSGNEGEQSVKYRTIIFAEDGQTYATTSYGIFNILNKILGIYGTPDTWETSVEVEVAKRPLGNGKTSLTFKLV